MAGWEQLGEVLGGGINRAGAFEQGRLRSAQTEGALGLARQRQLENIALDQKNRERERTRETLAATGMDPAQSDLLANIMLGETGSDFAAGTQGMGRLQEQNFRDTLANPEAPLGDQFAAQQGVKGEVANPLDMMGSDNYVDLRNLPEPGAEASLYSTPTAQATTDLRERVGESQINANRALEQQRLRAPNTGPPKNPLFDGAPSGWMVDPDDPTGVRLKPRPGGPADADSGGNPIGSIERRFLRRVTTAAENTIDDLEFFLGMPSGVSVGRFGGSAGMKGEDKLIGALMYQAKYQMSDEDTNMYNMALGGFSEQLRTLEMQGMRGAASIAAQFDALRFEAKDSPFQRMAKLARVRQTVENGISPNLAAANLPASERQYMEALLTRVRATIPFTPRDVLEWRAAQQRNPAVTLGEVVDQKRAEGQEAVPSTGGAAAAPAASGAAPQVEAWERGPDGKLRRVGAQ